MTTEQYPLFIIDLDTLINPTTRVATVTDNRQTLALEALDVDIIDIPECDNTILEAPVTSSFLTVSSVEDTDYM